MHRAKKRHAGDWRKARSEPNLLRIAGVRAAVVGTGADATGEGAAVVAAQGLAAAAVGVEELASSRARLALVGVSGRGETGHFKFGAPLPPAVICGRQHVVVCFKLFRLRPTAEAGDRNAATAAAAAADGDDAAPAAAVGLGVDGVELC